MPSQFYIASLLERGVRTLLYSGTYDWQCNWAATRLWLEKLEWTGSAQYKANAWRDWTVDGHKAGEVKTAGPLTFATVRGAGHMISRFGRLSGIEGPRALTLASFAVNTSRTTSPWRRRRWSPSGWRRASYNKATAPRRLRVGSWRTPRAFSRARIAGSWGSRTRRIATGTQEGRNAYVMIIGHFANRVPFYERPLRGNTSRDPGRNCRSLSRSTCLRLPPNFAKRALCLKRYALGGFAAILGDHDAWASRSHEWRWESHDAVGWTSRRCRAAAGVAGVEADLIQESGSGRSPNTPSWARQMSCGSVRAARAEDERICA